MPNYFICIERLEIVEVNAKSEEAAIQKIKDELYAKNPRDTAKISVAKIIE